MKRINKIFGLSLSLAAVFGLASCSNEVSEPANNPDNGSEDVVLNLVSSPDFYAWSGSEVLGDTRGTRGYATDESGHKYYYCNEEVEVNLSILDSHAGKEANTDKYDVKDLAAKLSVHVRQAVETATVTLPIPTRYIIDSDDLLIFNSHQDLDLNEVFKQVGHSATYKISIPQKENVAAHIAEVSVNVTFQGSDAETPENSGTVTVEINNLSEEVIDACFAKNNDGLNFEVYIYLAEYEVGDYSKEELQGSVESEFGLNRSTIEFEENPNYYINAFNYNYVNGNKVEEVNPNDCTVSLVAGGYDLVGTNMVHLNGSPYNTIYVLSTLENGPDHKHSGSYDPNEEEDEEESGNEGGTE